MDKKSLRRSTVWTRDKISKLINLYRQQECLWNHHVEEYRSKDHRSKAIEMICNALRITKYDFGKKIHNLRNQFNSEMKKLERRMEEAGDTVEDDETLKAHRCRWEHFEPLMFLRKVIEPRPGYQSSYPSAKKIRLKYEDANLKNEQSNINEEKSGNSGDSVLDIQEYELEEAPDIEHDDDMQEFEEEFSSNGREENFNFKVNSNTNRTAVYRNSSVKKDVNPNSIATRKTFYTCLPKNNLNQSTTQLQDLMHIEENQPTVNTVIEMPNREHNSMTTVLPVRDQWDIFGELIANEFRLLNSDKSRKKLKRKIMHDLLIIGEEDDNCK